MDETNIGCSQWKVHKSVDHCVGRIFKYPGSGQILTKSLKHQQTYFSQNLNSSHPCRFKVASKKSNTTTVKVPGDKMDTCVPSPNLMSTPFAQSPHSMSIYDQDRQSMFYGSSKVNNDVEISAFTSEDIGLLDEHFENSSLKSILTPEMISSMASSSSTYTSTHPWESKYNPEDSHDPSTSTDTAFMLPGVDSDLLLSNLLNIDSNDSKFSFQAFDFESMTSTPSLCHTPVPSSESKQDFTDTSVDRFNPISRSKDSIGQDFVQKKFTTMKSNFPPRKVEPPVVVVAPVNKVPEEDNKSFDRYPAELIKDSKSDNVKAAVNNISSASCVDMSELPPQTVPSFGNSIETVSSRQVKVEPVSPDCQRREHLKRNHTTEDKWEDVMHFMHGDTTSPTRSKRRRCDSGSSGHTSEDGDDDEYVYNNDDDSDDDADLDDDLANIKPGDHESLISGGKKAKQYFWQYNLQAKGPKGTRLKLAVGNPSDPHVLNGFEDPVFDECNTMVAGIRHGGKARKGDGNEVTPNPHKLFKIGHQLLRLNKKINACQLGSDVPVTKRNESRKEKNKLASRACRLKKKAQHEANKIKLHGLEKEHGQINNVLRLIWPALREKAKALMNKHSDDEKNDVTNKLTEYISTNLKSMVAGNTTEYVNNVIMTVERGDTAGGLKLKSRKT